MASSSILNVKVIEAKALLNVSGPVKSQAWLKQGSKTSLQQTSVSVEENNNPVWNNAEFDM